MTEQRPSARELFALADFTEDQRVVWPPTIETVRALGLPPQSPAVDIFLDLVAAGSPRLGVAVALRQIAAAYETASQRPVLVASGPRHSSGTRDTAVVMEELFTGFERELLVVGFAIHHGEQIFTNLAKRYDAFPHLKLVMCLNISRQAGDTTVPEEIIARFVNRFCEYEWPGKRLPSVYFDPRGLLEDH